MLHVRALATVRIISFARMQTYPAPPVTLIISIPPLVPKGDSMMLATLNEPGRELAGGVQFVMMDGLARVACWVSREALDGVEGGNPSQHDRAVRFERHRLKIEQLASKQYEAGEKSPIVMTFDLGRYG
jgi:Protein of unknown function (DUF1488)